MNDFRNRFWADIWIGLVWNRCRKSWKWTISARGFERILKSFWCETVVGIHENERFPHPVLSRYLYENQWFLNTIFEHWWRENGWFSSTILEHCRYVDATEWLSKLLRMRSKWRENGWFSGTILEQCRYVDGTEWVSKLWMSAWLAGSGSGWLEAGGSGLGAGSRLILDSK